MSEKKSSNPKDILAREERRVLLHLIPGPALVEEALAMMDGAEKYGPYNWREEGVGACTYVSAAMRHIVAWLDGEERAPDSGHHHLAHARACLGIIIDSQARENLVDDRPPKATTAEAMDAVKRGDEGAEPCGACGGSLWVCAGCGSRRPWTGKHFADLCPGCGEVLLKTCSCQPWPYDKDADLGSTAEERYEAVTRGCV